MERTAINTIGLTDYIDQPAASLGERARQVAVAFLVAAVGLATARLAIADEKPGVTPEQLLNYKPRLRDVEVEWPTNKELPQCKVTVEKTGKFYGYVLLGPSGQVLRRFYDTNGDGKVDQWRYFHFGIEVCRDLDTNANEKPDESRCVNLGGTRWGLDRNEDGRIDTWKVLSPAEASKEAIRAMLAADDTGLQALMFNEADAKSVGLAPSLSQKLLENSRDAGKKAKAVLANSKALVPQSKWIRFDALLPSLIPVDEEKATADLQVYENAMCIVETANQPVLVQLGEMIRVGEVWKLTQVPQPIESNKTEGLVAGGILMQPLLTAIDTAGGGPAPSPEAQKLLEQLQKLDQAAPQLGADREALVRFNQARVDLLSKLINLADSDEERQNFLRQMVDGVSVAVQSGAYPDGLVRLKTMEAEAKKNPLNAGSLPYIVYRRMFAEYHLDMQQDAAEKKQEAHKKWLEDLEAFVNTYPDSDDGADAMMQLGSMAELSNNLKEAGAWYTRLAKDRGKTPAGLRAQGAIRRLNLKGEPFTFSGPALSGGTIDFAKYRGRVTLVIFWATLCQPCTEQLPEIRAMYQQYQKQGFEVVGVCLDVTKDGVDQYIQQHKVPWPHVFQPGGLDSGPATQFGVITLPTMFLVGKDGRVVNRNVTLADLKAQLPELLKK